MKTVGLDIGYMSVKCVIGIGENGKFSIPSVVGTADVSRVSVAGNSNNMIVKFGDNSFLVGDAAVRQSRMTMRREDRHWFMSPEYLALAYAAIYKAVGDESKIKLVTGLPVAFFDDKSALEEVLSGYHEWKVNGKEFGVEIANPVVTMQPFGTYLNNVFGNTPNDFDVEFVEKSVGVLDIGSKTTNILTAQDLEEIRKDTTSVNIGGWEIMRAFRENIAATYPAISDMKDHQVAEIIIRRTVRSFGAQKEIGGIVDETVKPFADEIIAHASAVWNSGELMDEIIVTGGGAYLIFHEIVKAFPHARRVSDPVFGNALGYWKFAEYLAGS